MRGLLTKFQPDGDFYEKAKGSDPVQFSRGHQVRLFDPCWSDASDDAQRLAESKLGAEDTFHYTNAAPQVQTYNDIDWGNLEDYLLDKAQTDEKLLTVFTGPIFRDDDPTLRQRPQRWHVENSLVILEDRRAPENSQPKSRPPLSSSARRNMSRLFTKPRFSPG